MGHSPPRASLEAAPVHARRRSRLLLAVTDLPRQQSLGCGTGGSLARCWCSRAPRSGRSTLVASAATAAGSGRGCTCADSLPGVRRLRRGRRRDLTRARTPHPPRGGHGCRYGGPAAPGPVVGACGQWAAGRRPAVPRGNVDALIPTIDEVLGPGQGNALLEAVIEPHPQRALPADDRPAGRVHRQWAGSPGLQTPVLGAATGTRAGRSRRSSAEWSPVASRGAASSWTEAATTTSVRSCSVRGPRYPAPTTTAAACCGSCRCRQPHLGGRSGRYLGCGRDAAAPVTLPARTSVLVTGPPGSGRSTALRALAQAIPSDALIVDDLDLADVATVTQVEAAGALSDVVLASASTEKVARPSAARSPPCVSAKRSSCCGPVCAMPVRPPASPAGGHRSEGDDAARSWSTRLSGNVPTHSNRAAPARRR